LDSGATKITFLRASTTIEDGASGPRTWLIGNLADRLRDVPREDLTRPASTYRPERFAVIASRVPSTGNDEVRPWPLRPLTEPCTIFTGQDIATVTQIGASSGKYSHWQSGPHRYSVDFRPLLPDETYCPERSSP
jgi:hypothetical protein